jgi:hypothetical protein
MDDEGFDKVAHEGTEQLEAGKNEISLNQPSSIALNNNASIKSAAIDLLKEAGNKRNDLNQNSDSLDASPPIDNSWLKRN